MSAKIFLQFLALGSKLRYTVIRRTYVCEVIAVFYSIGHSNHKLGRFLGLLHRHRIQVVADVRSLPYSSFVKHFNRELFQHYLEQQGIDYHWLGGLLGGDNFVGKWDLDGAIEAERTQAGLNKLEDLAAGGRRVAILCAERDPVCCHRFFVLTYALAKRGKGVRHVLFDGRAVSSSRLEQDMASRLTPAYHQLSLFESPDRRLVGAQLYRSYFSSPSSPRAG